VETRHAIRRRVPPWAWYGMLRASGFLPSPINTAPLQRVASESPERLTDATYLTEELLPAMGLSGGGAGAYPPELQSRTGKGVQHFQLPIQFGPYLATVARAGVSSYIEIGVEHGGTFAITVDVLRRVGNLRRAVAVDLGPTPRVFRTWSRPEAEFVAMSSHTQAFARLVAERGPFDLAFLDGDHSEAGVRQDFELLRPHARMIALHDIIERWFPEVGRVWGDIRRRYAREYNFQEFVANYDRGPSPTMGIGLATRRDAAAA
jgi:cephalosporin hydroxylase